jgi:hypothetical protein
MSFGRESVISNSFGKMLAISKNLGIYQSIYCVTQVTVVRFKCLSLCGSRTDALFN